MHAGISGSLSIGKQLSDHPTSCGKFRRLTVFMCPVYHLDLTKEQDHFMPTSQLLWLQLVHKDSAANSPLNGGVLFTASAVLQVEVGDAQLVSNSLGPFLTLASTTSLAHPVGAAGAGAVEEVGGHSCVSARPKL